jgi:hypothetical protein
MIATLLILAACGGGGGGGGGGPGVTAPSGLSYSAPATMRISQPITAMSPTVSGTVTSYSVSPALPSGLTLNTTTGVISGTPTAVTASTIFTITASNSAGSTSATISIAITDVAPDIVYLEGRFDLTTGVARTVAPVNTGGAATAWTITPALPAGLSFDASTGAISGTPSAPSAPVSYLVTAQNSGGSDSVVVIIAVNSGVLLSLGHAEPIQTVRSSGDRVFSQDVTGFWKLWNAQTAAVIAEGQAPCRNENCIADLKGSTLILWSISNQYTDLTEVRSAVDGRLLSTIVPRNPDDRALPKLASDGSYVAYPGRETLSVHSLTGEVLFTRNGRYSDGKTFAAPNELRVAGGPAGAFVVEKISVPAGVTTLSPSFLGNAHSWFIDGERLLTIAGNIIWVYSPDGQQQDFRTLPGTQGLTGQGNWFWTYNSNTLDVYAVGASASPTASYSFTSADVPRADGNQIGVLPLDNRTPFTVIDLSGTAPNRTDITPPTTAQRAFGVADGGWVLGNRLGQVIKLPRAGGDHTRFSLGAVNNVVTSSNRILVSLATGPIIMFNAQTRAEEGRLDAPGVGMKLSSDGSVLATRDDRTVRILSLPSGTEIETLTYSSPDTVTNIELSASGQYVGVTLSGNTRTEVFQVGAGGTPLLSSAGSNLGLKLSPNGSIARADGSFAAFNVATSIYSGATLIGATPGVGALWLDDNRLLVHRYNSTSGGQSSYSDTVIASPNGAVGAPLPFRNNIGTPQIIDADRVYVFQTNRIVSLSSGRVLWESPIPKSDVYGGVTARHVIFRSDAVIRIEPY